MNGSKVARTASESGRALTMTATWASGKTTKCGDMECISGKTATSTKESGLHLLRMVKEPILLPTKMSMQASTKMESPEAMVNISGSQEQSTSENLTKARSTEKVTGRNKKQIRRVISIKGTILMIKSMDTASSIGRVATTI